MKRIFVISLLFAGLLISCSTDSVENIQDDQLKLSDMEDAEKEPCFTMVYPITFNMPDGTSVEANSREEIGTIFKDWKVENPGSEGRPTMQFPVEVTLKGGITKTISNKMEMKKIKEDCEKQKKPCFRLVYPVSFLMPDGTVVTGEDRKETGAAIKAWYTENPGNEERPAMQYPVEITFRDGNTKTLNSDEEMKAAKKDCEPRKKRCFEWVYPITYDMPDGTSITIESKDDKENRMALRAWYKENPDVQEKPALQFPVEVIFKDGSTATAASEAEMKAIREDCE